MEVTIRLLIASMAILVFFALLFACMAKEMTPEDRVLSLQNQYDALEQTYKSHFTHASEEERIWMQKNIAPVLDNAREALLIYSTLMVAEDYTEAEKKRLEVLNLLREASNRLLEVKE